MVYDIELVEGAYGPDEGFSIIINDVNGIPDNLTAYTTVRLVISDVIYTSPPIRNHIQLDDEFSVDSQGVAKYLPTDANPVPTFGKHYIQIFRTDTTKNIPTQKYSLLITQGVPTS